jgi:DNA-binding response OmpR family regulator
MMQARLEHWGHEVVCAADGDEAWQILQQWDAPRLLVLDRMMPGKSGIELCRDIRDLVTAIAPYIILLTGMGDKENIVEGFDAGADDYVTKPFHSAELRARIKTGQRILELQFALARRVADLEESLAHVKTLQGILPVCMHCQKIRNDQESWQKIDTYIQEHTDALISHGLCPECLEAFYPKSELERFGRHSIKPESDGGDPS